MLVMQRDVGHKTRKHVIDQHENGHGDHAINGGFQSRWRWNLSPESDPHHRVNDAGVALSTDFREPPPIRGRRPRRITRDAATAGQNRIIDIGRGLQLAIQDDGEAAPPILAGHLGKAFSPFRRERKSISNSPILPRLAIACLMMLPLGPARPSF